MKVSKETMHIINAAHGEKGLASGGRVSRRLPDEDDEMYRRGGAMHKPHTLKVEFEDEDCRGGPVKKARGGNMKAPYGQ